MLEDAANVNSSKYCNKAEYLQSQSCSNTSTDNSAHDADYKVNPIVFNLYDDEEVSTSREPKPKLSNCSNILHDNVIETDDDDDDGTDNVQRNLANTEDTANPFSSPP